MCAVGAGAAWRSARVEVRGQLRAEGFLLLPGWVPGIEFRLSDSRGSISLTETPSQLQPHGFCFVLVILRLEPLILGM